jgi:DNA topoisomerase VI subunit A
LQLEMNLKSEQQAFASRGLDFVTKEYLPSMLSEIGVLKR